MSISQWYAVNVIKFWELRNCNELQESQVTTILRQDLAVTNGHVPPRSLFVEQTASPCCTLEVLHEKLAVMHKSWRTLAAKERTWTRFPVHQSHFHRRVVSHALRTRQLLLSYRISQGYRVWGLQRFRFCRASEDDFISVYFRYLHSGNASPDIFKQCLTIVPL